MADINSLTSKQRIRLFGFDPLLEKKDESFTIQRVLQEAKNVTKADRDLWIIITGDERVGKSTLSFRLGRLIDKTFNHERPAFTANEFKAKHVKLEPGQFLPLDESTQGAFNRDAMAKKNKELVKYAVVCGERNAVNALLFPNLQWVDPYFRNHRAHYWIHVHARGEAIPYQPQRTPFHKETYWLPGREFEFDPLNDHDWKAYLKIKHEMVGQDARRTNPDHQPQTKTEIIQKSEPLVSWIRRILESR